MVYNAQQQACSPSDTFPWENPCPDIPLPDIPFPGCINGICKLGDYSENDIDSIQDTDIGGMVDVISLL